MIQELFGGLVQESKIPLINPSSSSSSISSLSQSASVSSPTSSSSSDAQAQAQAQAQQNLRCPRCDSSNTKFCYYNNYNLTQPRHFCKTCRRYWTKGGALRNVPIGGGCRKAKAAVPAILPTKPGGGCGGSGKAKPMTPIDVMGRVAGLGVGLDHHHNHNPELLPPSPILWASMPHSSHLLALFRASQMQNPNPNPNPTHSLLNSIRIKEEGAMLGGAAVVTTEPNCALNAHGLSLDPHLNGSCSSSMWRNENQFHNQYHQQQQQLLPQQNLLLLSDVPTSTGIQELYQRLRSSSTLSNSNNCSNDHLQSVANNVGSANTCSSSVAATATMATTTTAASVMDPIPLPGGDFGYWNPSWSADLSTATNGTFP